MSDHSNATLIRNGRVITATDDYVADVLLKPARTTCCSTSRYTAPMISRLPST